MAEPSSAGGADRLRPCLVQPAANLTRPLPLPGRRAAAQAEADRLAEREASLQAEARLQTDRHVELEKLTASLQLELRALSAKYEQESRSLRELRQRRTANQQEANVELVKCESSRGAREGRTVGEADR